MHIKEFIEKLQEIQKTKPNADILFGKKHEVGISTIPIKNIEVYGMDVLIERDS